MLAGASATANATPPPGPVTGVNGLPAQAVAAVNGLPAQAVAAVNGLPASAVAAAGALARQAALATAPAGARIEVTPGTLDPRLHLAACARIEPYLPPAVPAWGRTRIGLRCSSGPVAWNIFYPLTVHVFAPGLVAAAPLPAGTVIEAGQLRPAEIDWADEASPPQVQAAALVGRTLARPLAAGEALRLANLRPRQWFAAGDTVRVVAQGRGFSVVGEGQALSNGIEGQVARVRTDNGRIVAGQPIGERRIEVAL
jgi:flagellar basal body P-ring formation protein FlgA